MKNYLPSYAIRACAVLMFCAGCSADVASRDANSGTDADSALADAGTWDLTEDTTSASVMISGTFTNNETKEVQPGVKVCVLDASPEICTTTNADGDFGLRFPVHSQVGITSELDTFESGIFILTTDDEDRFIGLSIVPSAFRTSLLASIGVTQDAAKGGFSISVGGKGLFPVIDPADGDEPWYLVDTTMSRSESGTPTASSFAGITNIPVGDHLMTLKHDTYVCWWFFGWYVDTPNTSRIPIRAGFMTTMGYAVCDS